jgi:hypothetical protein
MKSPPVPTALLGLPADERRVLVSALSSLSASTLLERELTWPAPAEADLLIVDISNPDALRQAEGLDHLWPRVRIQYGARGSDAEVTRPLRVQALTQALSAAFARLETAQQTPSPSTASLAQPVTPSDPPDGAQAGAASARVYRGQRY